MAKSVDIASIFGDDVVHLHGNLFRVRRDRIRMAPSGLSVENGKLVYGNPRWFVNAEGDMEARGTESSKMEELKDSILNSGLDNPIRLRPINGDEPFLEVVNGERRFRCIEHLCESDEMCQDSSSGKKKKATEAYEWVECRIEWMDDKTALGIALKTNETSEVIGDVASLQVVKTMRLAEYSDQEILRATGKSLSWLRETDKIMSLDPKSLDHFHTDKITRKAAIQLALIENAEERISLLERIVEVAIDRKASKMKALEEAAERSEMESEIADAAAYAAGEGGDEKESKRLAEKSAKAKKKAEKAKDERRKVSAKPAKADARDIKKAKGPKPLPPASIKSEYLNLIDAAIENEGFDEDGESMGLDLGVLTAVAGVLKAILEGEEDAMSVLSCYCALEVEDQEAGQCQSESSVDSCEEDSDEDDSDEDDDEGGDSYIDSDYDEETAPENENEFRQAGLSDDDFS